MGGAEQIIVPTIAEFILDVKPVLLVSIHPMFMKAFRVVAVLDHLQHMCPYLYHIKQYEGERLRCGAVVLDPIIEIGNMLAIVEGDHGFDVLCLFTKPASVSQSYSLQSI